MVEEMGKDCFREFGVVVINRIVEVRWLNVWVNEGGLFELVEVV